MVWYIIKFLVKHVEPSWTKFLLHQNYWLKNTKNCNIRLLHNFRYIHKTHSGWPTCTRYATRLLDVPLRNYLAQDRCQHHVCWICNRWCWLFRDFRWNYLHERNERCMMDWNLYNYSVLPFTQLCCNATNKLEAEFTHIYIFKAVEICDWESRLKGN